MTKEVIPFFKLRYAFESRWRVVDAATFIYGLHPQRSIKGVRDQRAVDTIIAELKGAISNNVVRPIGANARINDWLFPLDSILKWAKAEDIPVDADVVEARSWAKGNILGKPKAGACDASFFQNTALAIWKDYDLTKAQTATYLEASHAQIAEKFEMWVFPKTVSTIEEYLRFVSNGRPSGRIKIHQSHLQNIDIQKIEKRLKKE